MTAQMVLRNCLTPKNRIYTHPYTFAVFVPAPTYAMLVYIYVTCQNVMPTHAQVDTSMFVFQEGVIIVRVKNKQV